MQNMILDEIGGYWMILDGIGGPWAAGPASVCARRPGFQTCAVGFTLGPQVSFDIFQHVLSFVHVFS